MQFLVACRILCVDVDFVIFEANSFRWVFVEYYAQRYQLFLFACEECMLLHLIPIRPIVRVVLHCVVKEIEALQ